MANWTNLKFKTWLKEINASSLSQEQLKNEAILFSEDFVEVDKKTIAKVVDDFEKEHKIVLADVSHSIFEEMGGQEGKKRGRRDVPPKDYFPQDENMLKMIQNETNLQKKFEMCNTLLSSRTEVKNHVQIKHEQELKKAFSKEATFFVSISYWLAIMTNCCSSNLIPFFKNSDNSFPSPLTI